MPSANKTPNYNLTQYSNNGSDKISALQDYNADMSKIDIALNNNANNISTKADAADVTAKLATKADANNVYNKTDIDGKVDIINSAIDKKANITDTYDKTDIDGKLENKIDIDERDTMVVFGDSMTVAATEGHQWWQLVANALSLKSKLYGVGGMGFITGTTPYISQLNNAIADMTIDKSKVKYVFVNGSTNDIYADKPTLETAIDAWFTLAKTTYPNAEFIVLSGLCGANVRWIDRITDEYRMLDFLFVPQLLTRHALQFGANVFTNAHLWLLYNTSLTQADGLHPNDAGFKAIAQYIISGLKQGTYAPTPLTMGNGINSDTTMSYATANTSNVLSSVTIDGYYNFVSQPDSATVSVNIGFVTAHLTAGEVLKFATIKDDDAHVFGIDVPFLKKLLPFSQINTHDELDRWIPMVITINTVKVSLNAHLYSKLTDNRLDNPSDASKFIYLELLYPLLKYPNGNGVYIYNLIPAANATVDISVSTQITLPIDGIYR